MVKLSKFVPLVVLALLALAPAASADCAPKLSQTFLDWKDQSWYTLAGGGDMESDEGWTLDDAKIASGNEPWQVNGASDSHSLKLPAGSSATSPYMCIEPGFPYFRVFARNTGKAKSRLKVEVIFRDSTGAMKVKKAGKLRFRKDDWRLSRRLATASGLANPKGKGKGEPEVTFEAAFRFTPMGDAGKWRIDDLFVDPRRRA
ncbi:MAG TPA: hypothetical protein VD790_02040 [Thermoleophilaceae bacterium]|nr:hypothetical protein [Thermoleophilaceae bacterium]